MRAESTEVDVWGRPGVPHRGPGICPGTRGRGRGQHWREPLERIPPRPPQGRCGRV